MPNSEHQNDSAIPTILVVLGATGDLMAKKIVPAVFNLHAKKELPPKFEFVGVSRRDWTDEDFRKHVRGILDAKGLASDVRRTPDIGSFLDLTCYHRLAFGQLADYAALKEKLEKIDARWGVCTNKLFYLSVPPQFYDEIFENLHRSHLTDPCSPEEGWTRVIVEKPFGSDEKTAKQLDAKLAKLFKEEQIYRIDHYLAKEMLQNILAFRFENNLFENEWNAEFIERINIRMYETIGVEDRGAFYDGVGALRDVGQNHLLQMLALVTMERPLLHQGRGEQAAGFGAEAVRAARADILERLEIPTLKQAADRSFRAQYDGFQLIKGVAPDSQTETYFKILGFLDHPRWAGVPIYMESGKRLREDVNEIEILLGGGKNKVIIQIEPTESITVVFCSKKPGHGFETEERRLTFDFREGKPRPQYTEEYEKLILDCIAGDQTLFVSSREIAAMWRFTDPFSKAWNREQETGKREVTALNHYRPNSDEIIIKAEEKLNSLSLVSCSLSLALIGLGKMGANLARNLREHGWHVVVYNRTPEKTAELEKEGFEGARSLEELVRKVSHSPFSIPHSPRMFWLMVTAGKPVDDLLSNLMPLLKRGDIVIDGGNSFFEDSMRRAKLLEKKGIKFLDAGVSGGPSGARNGACMMIGGDREAFGKLEPLFRDGSVPGGYAYFGNAGAGHFVKMVHNGIEYGMMQSIAEGFALMKKSPFKLDLAQVARIYQHQSVIESRLVGWLESGFKEFGQDLKKVSGTVNATGEGEWTIKTGKKWGMKLAVIEDAFKFRMKSKKSPSYIGKILSALRNQFGGHSIK
ncbi:MAG: glucose-6-phosphate dehydrogenase [Patescibacteria group bacterium]|nr:glucose-6-phosphate dehydrogenase [Patescibacteria group bacterium]